MESYRTSLRNFLGAALREHRFLHKWHYAVDIPHFVLVDDLGQTITIDARKKIPQDKAGIGFP